MLYRLERTGKVQHEKPHRGVAPSPPYRSEQSNPPPAKRPGSTLVYGARRDPTGGSFSPAYVPLPLTSELRRCQSQLPSSSRAESKGQARPSTEQVQFGHALSHSSAQTSNWVGSPPGASGKTMYSGSEYSGGHEAVTSPATVFLTRHRLSDPQRISKVCVSGTPLDAGDAAHMTAQPWPQTSASAAGP